MKGSHKKDFCWTKYPHLKKGANSKHESSSDRGRKSRSRSREDTPYRPRRVTNTCRDSSVEKSPSPKKEKKKKKDKRQSKSRRVRNTPRGLKELQSSVQAVPLGSSIANSSSIFPEYEPPIVEATCRTRRIRRTRAQEASDKEGDMCKDMGRRLRELFTEQQGSD